MTSPYITKGMRVRAKWWTTKLVALSGMQMKAEATPREVVGVVRHVRGNHPTNPTEVRIYIEAEGGSLCDKCGVFEVEVQPDHIIEVLT